MARNSGFGIQVLLKDYIPRFLEVFEGIDKSLKMIAGKSSNSDCEDRLLSLEEKMEAIMKSPIFTERLEKTKVSKKK